MLYSPKRFDGNAIVGFKRLTPSDRSRGLKAVARIGRQIEKLNAIIEYFKLEFG